MRPLRSGSDRRLPRAKRVHKTGGAPSRGGRPSTRLHHEEIADRLLDVLPDLFLAALLALLIGLGLILATSARGIVPGYDAVEYVRTAHFIHAGLLGDAAAGFTRMGAAVAVTWARLPFTNTLDVLLLGLAYDVADYHLSVVLIHACYLLLFAYLARRLLGRAPALLLLVWATSQTYFLHQFTNLLSEMKVGMFLALFVVALFHDDVQSRRWPLFWITVLLLLLRTADLLFILPLVVAHAAFVWRRADGPRTAVAAAKAVGLACLVLLPLLVHELKGLIPYLYLASYSDMAQNWRDMAGVSGKWDLVMSYVTGVAAYNRDFAISAVLAIAVGAALSLRDSRHRLTLFRGTVVGSLVVFAVLTSAQSNNIMIVYWVYALLGVVAVCLLKALLMERHLALLAYALIPVAIAQNANAFSRANDVLIEALPVQELAESVCKGMAGVSQPSVFQNYAGIGPLDPHGLEIASPTVVGWVPVNSISYNTPLSAYLEALDRANVALIANRNFLWPPYIGINRRTEELARYVGENASRMGFTRARRLMFDADPSRFIDVYTRSTPTAVVKE